MTDAVQALLQLAVLGYAGAVIVMGAWMLVAPAGWSAAVLRYLRWPPMHRFEIVFCLTFGMVFVLGAPQTLWPWAYRALGGLLLLVGSGLVLAGRRRHAEIVARLTPRLAGSFRWLAIPTVAIGGLLAVGVIT